MFERNLEGFTCIMVIILILLFFYEDSDDFYENIKEIKNPDDVIVLVNKNNVLPNNYIPNDLRLINNRYAYDGIATLAVPTTITIWLTMKYTYNYRGNSYTETITALAPSITINIDSSISASFGTYDKNKGWPLTIKNADASTKATITFKYMAYGYLNCSKTLNISDLLKGTNPIREIILEQN